ncbi:MAG: hypothetical protein DHS20C14_08910 [Phycisphaeraceae bacterium]|nr:MAG: hypothetical protein DHS20C14_08910 [Phycisphaeraceae bacterium]
MVSTTLGAGFMLVGVWQPLVMLLPLIAWGWMVSSVLDKHAARFFLGRESWGLVHLVAGLASVIAVLFMPVEGVAGFGAGMLVMIAILALDIGLFVAIANRDDRVPEHAHLTLDFKKWKDARDAKSSEKSLGTSKLQIQSPKKTRVPVPEKGTPEYEVRLAAEDLVLRGREARASQIDIMPAGEKQYAASFMIDGVRQAGEPIAPQQAIAVIDFWKACGGLDVSDRRRKQSANIAVSSESGSNDLRLTTSGSQSGLRLSVNFDPAAAVKRDLDDMGLLDPPQLGEVKKLINDPGGLVLLAAPSDSGRTTTLYTLIKAHDAYTSNVQTLEFDIEDAVEGVRQTGFDPTKEGADYATQLRSMLRRDPDVVGAAEVPDVQTAQEISKADLERTRVYASIRADGATAALQIWTRAVGDAKKASADLKCVIAQRLVRKLCDNCRVAYAPPPDMLKKLGLPADKVKQLHKKGGQVLVRSKPETCAVCDGIGYLGQIGVFEVLPIGAEERELIAKENWSGLRAAMRKKQMPSLAQVALRRAVEGVTSVEEVTRVTAPPKKKSDGKQRAAS